MKVGFIIVGFLLSLNVVLAADAILVKGKIAQVQKKQFLSALQRLDENDKKQILNDENKISSTLESYYVIQVALAKAKASGLYQTPKMQAIIEKAIGDVVIKELYYEHLKNKLSNKSIEALAKTYYKVHKNKYKTQPEVDASHILISAKDSSKEEAKLQANKLKQQLIKGSKFEELATKFSDDPTAVSNKGRLGFFSKAKMVKPFADAVFKLENIGDISPIIESEFGFHIIRLEAKKASSIMTFEQVREGIIKKIIQDKSKTAHGIFIKDLLDIDNIEVNKAAIKALVVSK